MEYLQQLRQATRAQHECLEMLPVMQFLSDEGWSLEAYVQVLMAFKHVFKAMQSVWQSQLPEHYLTRMEQRMEALERDLAQWTNTLMLSQPPASVSDFDCVDIFGFLYVIEGSSKGAKLISHSLAKRGLDAENGAAYFNLYHDSVTPDWRRFATDFETHVKNERVFRSVVDAAQSTFSFFIDHFKSFGAAHASSGSITE